MVETSRDAETATLQLPLPCSIVRSFNFSCPIQMGLALTANTLVSKSVVHYINESCADTAGLF